MADEFAFHVRNAHPGDLVALLATLEALPRLTTIADIVEQAENLGFSIRDRQRLEALVTARDLGLVDRDSTVLTSTGQTLAQLEVHKPDVFPDIVHGLHYTLWDERRPGVSCFSWSYRTLCQLLWRGEIVSLDNRRDVASTIESAVRTAFGRSDIALSPKSVGGALLWLAELSPPVLDEHDMRFNCRAFCAPELFILAADFVYGTHDVDYGANLLLTEERRDAICQVCLLDPAGFDRVLDYAVAQFDYLEKGLGGGWGRYLTLHRAPQLEDFL